MSDKWCGYEIKVLEGGRWGQLHVEGAGWGYLNGSLEGARRDVRFLVSKDDGDIWVYAIFKHENGLCDIAPVEVHLPIALECPESVNVLRTKGKGRNDE